MVSVSQKIFHTCVLLMNEAVLNFSYSLNSLKFWHNWHYVEHLLSLVNCSTILKGTVDYINNKITALYCVTSFPFEKWEFCSRLCNKFWGVSRSWIRCSFLLHLQNFLFFAVFQVPGLFTIFYWADQHFVYELNLTILILLTQSKSLLS